MNERIEKIFEYGTDNTGTKNFYNRHYYIQKPDKIKSTLDCANADKTAKDEIEFLKQKIEFLQIYRTELYKRYQEINSATYHKRITIERQRQYYENKVFYYVTVESVPDRADVETRVLRRDRFEGKQRHEALKLFQTLCKCYPQAEIVKKIEKSKWER